jgi:hypothetical protein
LQDVPARSNLLDGCFKTGLFFFNAGALYECGNPDYSIEAPNTALFLNQI